MQIYETVIITSKKFAETINKEKTNSFELKIDIDFRFSYLFEKKFQFSVFTDSSCLHIERWRWIKAAIFGIAEMVKRIVIHVIGECVRLTVVHNVTVARIIR